MTTKVTDAVFEGETPPLKGINLVRPLSVDSGGTGLDHIAVGAVLVGNGTDAAGQSPPGTAGLPFVSTGPDSIPVFGTFDVTAALTGVIAVPHGGTGLAEIAPGSVVCGNGTGVVGQSPPGTAGLPLVSTGPGSIPVFGTMDGGAITGVIAVSHGGTGLDDVAVGAVMCGNGTNPVGQSPPGTAGMPFVSTGPDSIPVFSDSLSISSLVINGVPFKSLGADVSYYISTTGSDSNDGSSAHPWATLAHAYATLLNTNFGTFTVYLMMGDGTYSSTETAFVATVGNWHIESVSENPAACIIHVTGTNKDGISIAGNANVTVRNISCRADNGYVYASQGSSHLTLSGAWTGPGNSQIVAYDGGNISIIGNYTIFGNADTHYQSVHGSITASQSALPVRIDVTPVDSGVPIEFNGAFADAHAGGYIRAVNANYNHITVAGPRFRVSSNGVIETDGTDPEAYFPGDSDVAPSTGGVYF